MAAGLGHCLGVTQKGDVVAWGWAAAGQLGLGRSHQGGHTLVHPTQVSMLDTLNMLSGVSMLCVNLQNAKNDSGHELLIPGWYPTEKLASGNVSGIAATCQQQKGRWRCSLVIKIAYHNVKWYVSGMRCMQLMTQLCKQSEDALCVCMAPHSAQTITVVGWTTFVSSFCFADFWAAREQHCHDCCCTCP